MTGVPLAARLARAGCVRADEEARLLQEAARTSHELDTMVARRVAGEPLEHVVGWAEFRGLRFVVEDGVFVPRARSGLLVDEAASVARCLTGSGRGLVVVDVCCGTGAIGAALAAEVPGVLLHATDIDPRAVTCAEANLAAWAGRVHQGDLFDGLPRRLRGRTDLVVSSPPYVPTDKIRLLPTEAREFESGAALDGGPDGLDLVRRIARDARSWLAPGGFLAVELADHQVDHATALLDDLGYQARAVSTEESAVVVGRRPL